MSVLGLAGQANTSPLSYEARVNGDDVARIGSSGKSPGRLQIERSAPLTILQFEKNSGYHSSRGQRMAGLQRTLVG